jgi:phosphoacetylglucosamine mutase
MGVFAVLRSVFTKEQVGIMATASHNKEVDNGIKMADPDGGMLAPDWENLAVRLVNALSTKEFLDILESLYRECELQSPFEPSTHDSVVIHFGRDTRSHSEFLSSLCIRASLLMGATVYDHGLLSTPQLHYIVMHSNPLRLPNCIPYAGWERGYYETLVGAYVALKTSSQLYRHQSSTNDPTRYLYVDCACGVMPPPVSFEEFGGAKRSVALYVASFGCPVVASSLAG